MNKMILIDGSSNAQGISRSSRYENENRNAHRSYLRLCIHAFKLVEYRPSHIAVAFDMSGPTFRHSEYSNTRQAESPHLPSL